MTNIKIPTMPISNVLFLNKKTFYKNGGCKITLVDKINEEQGQGKTLHPVTGEVISFSKSTTIYDGIPQKKCSIYFKPDGKSDSIIHMLKYTPIGFPMVEYKMGNRQKDSAWYECIDKKLSDNKKIKLLRAIHAHMKKNFKKWWDALGKEYIRDEKLLALGKLEVPIHVDTKKDSTTAKVEEVVDNTLSEDEFNGLDGKAKKDYARQFGVTGRSHQDLIKGLNKKGKLK